MKKTLLILSTLFISISLFSRTKCNCGTHEDGITTYWVYGEDCCNGGPSQHAFFIKYIRNDDGGWDISSSTIISGIDAQDTCCDVEV